MPAGDRSLYRLLNARQHFASAALHDNIQGLKRDRIPLIEKRFGIGVVAIVFNDRTSPKCAPNTEGGVRQPLHRFTPFNLNFGKFAKSFGIGYWRADSQQSGSRLRYYQNRSGDLTSSVERLDRRSLA